MRSGAPSFVWAAFSRRSFRLGLFDQHHNVCNIPKAISAASGQISN